MSGIVYFLVNKAMPGLVKIGYTEVSLQDRLAQLNSTGVPAPFDVLASFMVNDAVQAEQLIHSELTKHRYSANREFFKISEKQVLERTFPIILDALSNNGIEMTESPNIANPSHGLETETIFLLQRLADYKRNQGYVVNDLLPVNSESEIETEFRLSSLKELGLVEERKGRDDWRGNIWKITSKGVKFIFDNGLVEDYMKERLW
jgi:hypothetical protein